MATPQARSPQGAGRPLLLSRPGSAACTALRRRVLEHAVLGEWAAVHEAVDMGGCNVNVQDMDNGFSLVHWAAHQGNEEELCWLLDKGAFPRLKDSRGHAAVVGAKGACRELLLQRAYSPVERVVYRPASLDLACLEEDLGGLDAEALNQPLWDESGAALPAVLAGRHGTDGFDALPLLTWLQERGANCDAVDEEGNALLHMVQWNLGFSVFAPVVEWALSVAQVQHANTRNGDGDTPAMICAYDAPTGDDAWAGLRLFEAAGANLAVGNAKGMNVVMVLARYQGDGPWLSWCQDNAGVKDSALCVKGRTVADYLALHGHPESDEEG
eukprot:TRINITY_DN31288_c0_g1_i1.p1 TRINITY_DN31288_c0_g1~~TRINITY_DN31288_c0_g1_i1.p1  ORF type:complete len:346 (-),score=46.76 TRINITY_DN31288_c0_g1_i1:354-1334(-)